MREENSADVLQSMMDGVVDIGVVDGNVPSPPGIRVLPYVKDRLVAVFPTAHPLAGRDQIAFAEIRESDHVGLETGVSLQVLVANAAASCGFQLKTRIEVKTMIAALCMVEVGLGVAVLPETLIGKRANHEKVRAVRLIDDWAMRDLVLCVKDQQPLTASANLLLQHLSPAEAPSTKTPPRPLETTIANAEEVG
jgi:DNA-binding transcriptional LysR family regulator